MQRKYLVILSAVLWVMLCPSAHGNDAAASTALGGIQLRREPRISMLKEKLAISDEKVDVEYEFLNKSNHHITTEVAFPIPPYSVTLSARGIRSFDGFKVWVEGKELKYQTEARAKLKGRDITETLNRFNIDVASLGHFDDSADQPSSADFQRLTASQKNTLVAAGIFSQDDGFPEWAVEKTYHWRQVFPAHKVVHVRHEYEPGIGFSGVEAGFLDPAARKKAVAAEAAAEGDRSRPGKHDLIDLAREIDAACVDPRLEKTLTGSASSSQKPRGGGAYVEMAWVDYILTTANSWKTPIGDFELLVQKPKRSDYKWYASFCWDGPVERIDAGHFAAKMKDFVPKGRIISGMRVSVGMVLWRGSMQITSRQR